MGLNEDTLKEVLHSIVSYLPVPTEEVKQGFHTVINNLEHDAETIAAKALEAEAAPVTTESAPVSTPVAPVVSAPSADEVASAVATQLNPALLAIADALGKISAPSDDVTTVEDAGSVITPQ